MWRKVYLRSEDLWISLKRASLCDTGLQLLSIEFRKQMSVFYDILILIVKILNICLSIPKKCGVLFVMKIINIFLYIILHENMQLCFYWKLVLRTVIWVCCCMYCPSCLRRYRVVQNKLGPLPFMISSK